MAHLKPPWIAWIKMRTTCQSIIHNGTHNSYECVEGLVADFIDKGAAQGLDTSCVEKIKRPPFTILK